MSVAGTFETPVFNGTFTQRVDARRVVIPSRWLPEKKTDEAGRPFEFTLVVWPGGVAGTCLRVLPPGQLAKLMKKLDDMPDEDPEKAGRKRYIGAHSMQAAVDKQGRICLPEEMARQAGIGDEVVLMGCLDKFEMWSVERSKSVENADSVMATKSLAMLG